MLNEKQKTISFPYPECDKADTTLDFCIDKDCEHLNSYDNWQTCHCVLHLAQLEHDCPYDFSEDKPEKVDFCYYCNNTEHFNFRNKKTKCALCNRFSSKTDVAEIEGLRAGIKAGIFKATYPYY